MNHGHFNGNERRNALWKNCGFSSAWSIEGDVYIALFVRYMLNAQGQIRRCTMLSNAIDKRNIPRADVAQSHYIISEEIIADTILRVSERQWD